ncbi:uncharacterized protein METZ01_LOCUS206143, partial [marine metagenome]
MIETAQLDDENWLDFPDYGFKQYFLWKNEETSATVALLDFEEGGGVTMKHTHASNQFMYCLDG